MPLRMTHEIVLCLPQTCIHICACTPQTDIHTHMNKNMHHPNVKKGCALGVRSLLSWQSEDLSSDPQHHMKSWADKCMSATSVSGGRDRRSPGACHPICQEPWAPNTVKDSVSKSEVEGDRRHQQPPSGRHI